MADIRPFKGIVYNKEKIKNLKDVTTPPYDVITKEEQRAFHEKSNYNIIRLILGEETEFDDLKDNKYTRAAGHFKSWRESGVLRQDAKDSIYFYQQDYHLSDGTLVTRNGFIALAKLEDFSSGKILPHEKTLSGPKSDRLKLMESCHANFSQIFSLYSDKELAINKLLLSKTADRAPDMDVTDSANVTHRIFKIDDAATIAKVVDLLKDNNLFIADGHHRYETALNFRNHIAHKGAIPADSPYNYVMMYFSNMDDAGLVVFPTHRVLFNLQDYQIDFLKSEISKYFTVIDLPFGRDNEESVRNEFFARLKMEGMNKHAFGMYCKEDFSYHVLVVDHPEKSEHIYSADMAQSLKKLDVTVLHSVLIDHLLGVGTVAQENQENLKYVKDADQAIDFVKSGKFQVVFLLNPTKVEQVKDVASSGNKMPQKSTFFYPKLLTGLVINSLNG